MRVDFECGKNVFAENVLSHRQQLPIGRGHALCLIQIPYATRRSAPSP